jgi:hypothetical protein
MNWTSRQLDCARSASAVLPCFPDTKLYAGHLKLCGVDFADGLRLKDRQTGSGTGIVAWGYRRMATTTKSAASREGSGVLFDHDT